MSKKAGSLSGEWSMTFLFLYSIITTVSVSLGRPYASSIFFIFPLYKESNALEKLTNL